ncbi:MAG: gluconate 2-dehydrogenase subunit 3 family protein [Bacteroidota bacterium]
MNRRSIIKNLGAGFIGLSSLPAWANNWKKEDFKGYNTENSLLIAQLVDTIIPGTNSPGAKSIGAHLLVERMIKDCYADTVQSKFNSALINLKSASNKNFDKTIDQLSATETISLLKNSEDKSSISLLKNLTVRAYINSEYYLTKHKNYQMAPAFFHGCVDV